MQVHAGRSPRHLAPFGWLSDGLATVFGALAQLRGGRAIHTRGVLRAGTAQMRGIGVTLSDGPAMDVIVRFSRAVGLPDRLPDINGLAIRFLTDGGHRDLLLATAGRGPMRRLLVPAVDVATSYSSIARFRLGDRDAIITAEVNGDRMALGQLTNDEPRDVTLHAHHSGGQEALGTIRLGAQLHDIDIRFDPMSTGPDVVPLGPINALRPPAYDASQASSA